MDAKIFLLVIIGGAVGFLVGSQVYLWSKAYRAWVLRLFGRGNRTRIDTNSLTLQATLNVSGVSKVKRGWDVRLCRDWYGDDSRPNIYSLSLELEPGAIELFDTEEDIDVVVEFRQHRAKQEPEDS